jgi:tetratricopeptide (TPR) repeat protein
VAVKVFEGLAINRGSLARATERLEAGGWPEGVMPVLSASFDDRPAVRVTPWMAYETADGQWRPQTLQQQLADFPGERSWPVVRDLAKALGRMHDRRVAHANLKPGNVFFDENGSLLLTDWALGNMPGVGHLEYTDALLYQAPEQLRDPGGYFEEEGYRWDVFSFGVLAYCLLNGRFPRCDETFRLVAPVPGEKKREGISADQLKIARNLEMQPDVTWPDEPANPLEQGYREVIDRCLALDPLARPAGMAEVAVLLDGVDQRVAAEMQRDLLLDQSRRAKHQAWRARAAALLLLGVAAVLGGLWQLESSQRKQEQHDRAEEIGRLRKTAAEGATARETLNYDRDVALARLQASRLVGDHLFAWAMEKGNRQLPPLDGRVQRLTRLERYYEDFLTRTGEIKALGEERARARLQLAEISLAKGDAKSATKRFDEALDAWKDQKTDADWELRVATDRLMLALLYQADGDPAATRAFDQAREALKKVPQGEVDADRVSQLLAILDFQQARLMGERGKDTKALEMLMSATKTLNRLVDERPEVEVLRSELAGCYLSSATILEGMGSLGDAREVRSLASSELTRLLQQDPRNPQLRLDLAGCYGSMAEASLLAGDVAAAESLSKQATELLEAILREQPDNTEAVSRLAAQRGLIAGLLRDRGKIAESTALLDEGIRMLQSVVASNNRDPVAAYRLALLWWQKGRILGGAGQQEQGVKLLDQSLAGLKNLDNSEYGLARAEQLKRSIGYVLGDLGHARQLCGRKEDAARTFSESVKLWEELLKIRPQNEEYKEGLSWSRQRLKELQ